MEQIAAHGALGGDLAMTEACFSMNNPRSRGGGTLWYVEFKRVECWTC